MELFLCASGAMGLMLSLNLGWKIGAWVPGAPQNMTPLLKLEQLIGKIEVVHWFADWTAEFDAGRLQNVKQHGAIPMITWEPWHW